MKSSKWNGTLSLIISMGLTSPLLSFGDGGIIVYASDSNHLGHPPPSSAAILDEITSVSFGTNNWVYFANVATGVHTVEVTTSASGYLPRKSPSDPDAVYDPDSDYGIPRNITVIEDETTMSQFIFDPTIIASGTIRDAWTMERIDNAEVEFILQGSTGSVSVCKYPPTASYASNWLSNAGGNIPTNTILYLNDYDLQITLTNYQTLVSSNVIDNALAGDEFDLGDIFIYPTDSNTNWIADTWEASYFGAESNVTADADADADGINNRDEYLAGTNPTNDLSCLMMDMTTLTNGTLELTWDTEADRTYRIMGTTNLYTNTWVQVAGSWEASNQTEMSWVETNMNLSWNNYYRVEVMPSTWTGTNQTLINTNRPTSGGGEGGGSYTNGLPPIP
jgi:hypothetical protein